VFIAQAICLPCAELVVIIAPSPTGRRLHTGVMTHESGGAYTSFVAEPSHVIYDIMHNLFAPRSIPLYLGFPSLSPPLPNRDVVKPTMSANQSIHAGRVRADEPSLLQALSSEGTRHTFSNLAARVAAVSGQSRGRRRQDHGLPLGPPRFSFYNILHSKTTCNQRPAQSWRRRRRQYLRLAVCSAARLDHIEVHRRGSWPQSGGCHQPDRVSGATAGCRSCEGLVGPYFCDRGIAAGSPTGRDWRQLISLLISVDLSGQHHRNRRNLMIRAYPK